MAPVTPPSSSYCGNLAIGPGFLMPTLHTLRLLAPILKSVGLVLLANCRTALVLCQMTLNCVLLQFRSYLHPTHLKACRPHPWSFSPFHPLCLLIGPCPRSTCSPPTLVACAL